MTELSFLLDLLLNHKLSKEMKDKISARLKEVEEKLTQPAAISQSGNTVPMSTPQISIIAPQAPSTLAAMAKHGELPQVVPTPPAQIAHTPAALAAMESRNRAIQEAVAGQVNKAEGRPRKF